MSDAMPLLDRYTTMGELALNVRRALSKMILPTAGLLAVGVAWLAWTHSPGWAAFILMTVGMLIGLKVWVGAGIGVPIMPLFVVQQWIISGLPILSGHEVVSEYPSAMITDAGIEVLVFSLVTAVAWRVSVNIFRPAPATARVLVGLGLTNTRGGLPRIGFWLAGVSTAYQLTSSLGLLDSLLQLLPSGASPILTAVTAAASACGFFLLAILAGAHQLSALARSVFWALVLASCLMSATSLLLSTAGIVLASVVIGLFWSTGRPPWRLILTVGAVVSLLNAGKYEMRSRYWESAESDGPAKSIRLTDLPSFYAEWAGCSAEAMTAPLNETTTSQNKAKSRGLLQRLNNLENLLYAIDSVERQHIPVLEGKTYAIIPPLLIPRLFWPNKPRTHEGQVMLNVHFKRQALDDTYTTYIAWGLLAEAYGNFGAIKGAIIVGLVLGTFFAWAEKYTSRKPLLSTEGLVAFAVFLGLANSYEMVASVMVTSIFQSLVPIIVACLPLVQRKVLVRPES